MDDLSRLPATDPEIIFRTRDELYTADMLIAALRGFDFFTWLDAHPGTVDDVARGLGFHRRPVDVMTTLFVAMDLVERDGEVLRPTARAREHLVTGSAWCAAPYFPRLSDRPIAQDLIQVLRTGEPVSFASRRDEADWHRAMETERFADEFLAAMDVRGRILAPELAEKVDLRERRRLLDIGGGSGLYACAFAARHPRLHASVLEKPPVDAIAARAIERRGFARRVDTIAADMLTDGLPPGCDVHLYSNVLHDWDEPIVKRLLHASADALPAGGQLVILDAFLNAGKTGPLSSAAYSVLLMHVTQGRCYSVAEMEQWLAEAGFEAPSYVPLALGRAAMVASRRQR